MRLALLFALIMVPTLGQAQPAPKVLEMGGGWQLDYAEERCRMAGVFGSGETRTVFYLEQYNPGSRFLWTVAGSAVEMLRRNSDVDVQFGPGFPSIKVSQADDRTLGTYGQAIAGAGYTPPIKLEDENTKASQGAESRKSGEPVTPAAVMRLDPEDGAKITTLSISQGGRTGTVLKLGNMRRAFEAMNACTENLASSWGIDVADLRSVAVLPKWVNQRETIRQIKRRYPSVAADAGSQADFGLRIIIADDGSVERCSLIAQTVAKYFSDRICPLIKAEGQFEPARDKAGKPVKSLFAANIIYRLE